MKTAFFLLTLLVLGVAFCFSYLLKDDSSSYAEGKIYFSQRTGMPARGTNYGGGGMMQLGAISDFSYDRNIRGSSSINVSNANRGEQLVASSKEYSIFSNSETNRQPKAQSINVNGSSQISYTSRKKVSSSFASNTIAYSGLASAQLDAPFASVQAYNDNLYDEAMTRGFGGTNPEPGPVVPIGSIFPLLLLGAIYLLIKMLL